MGPLEFCITIHPILLLLKSELRVAFLADLTLGRKADAVAHDVQLIAQESANLGLTQPRKVRNSFIHSFRRLIWRLFKRLLLRGAPSPATDKKEGLERDVKFGRVGHQHGTQHSAHSRTRKTGYRNTIKKKLKPMKISLTSGVTTPGQLRAVSGLNLFLPGLRPS